MSLVAGVEEKFMALTKSQQELQMFMHYETKKENRQGGVVEAAIEEASWD